MLIRRRLIGAGVILAGILFVTIVALRPDPFSSTRTVWVDFDSVQGLGSIDRDVRAAGVNVGKIGTVERHGDDARVQLLLSNSAVEVHEDAFAELRPHTLFEGTAFVDLDPGSPSAPPMRDGGEIPRSHSAVYVSLDSALRILRKPVRESLRGLIRTTANTVQGSGVSGLQRTLKGAPGLTRDLAPAARALTGPHGTELAGAVRGLSGTVDDLAANEAALRPLAGRATRTEAALNTEAGKPLDSALRNLPGALDQLQRTGPSLTKVLGRLQVVATNARPALPDLNAALADLPALLDRAEPVLRDSPEAVSNLGTVLARLGNASPAIQQVVADLGPPTATMSNSTLPFLHKDSKLGQPTYVQLLTSFTDGTGAFAPFQTPLQNPLGAGHLVRLGAYFDPAGTIGSVEPCSVIAGLSPEAAAALQAAGVCS
jgi:phospholipid/cholesterol/gamma-HCH transport system substrate-binding protein